ncbi:MAG: alpha/beta fold hydrolase [Flavitalea sp.]
MKLEQKVLINFLSTKLKMMSLVSKRKAAEAAFELFCTPIVKSKKPLPALFLESEQMDFEVGGYSIHGYRWKKEHAKKILIVHGFGSSSGNFEKYVGGLLNKGFEVLAFDAPAHGLTTGKTMDFLAFVGAIKKINEMYGPIDGFLAHSYGGLAVTYFLESVKNDQKKVVLIAPATETATTIDSFFRFLNLGKELRKEFDNIIFKKDGQWPEYYSVRRSMNYIQSSVLWFHDEEDQLTPVADALKVKADAHPNVKFRITKGLGHSRIYRDPSIVREVLEFF